MTCNLWLQHLLLHIYETIQYILCKILKEGQPPVKPEPYGGKSSEDYHHILSGKIPGDGPFYHHRLIGLEWCLDLEQIQS